MASSHQKVDPPLQKEKEMTKRPYVEKGMEDSSFLLSSIVREGRQGERMQMIISWGN